MAIPKKVLISYIVGGVGLTGGIVGLAVGLTKKPDVGPSYTLTLEYESQKYEKGEHTKIKQFENVSRINRELANTISLLPYDDVFKDTTGDEHHFRTFNSILSSKGDTIYSRDNPGAFKDYVLNGDTTVYVATKRSHYHVYLCYEDSSEVLGQHVYNPNDWYPTKEYDPHTKGFTERGEVEHHEHQKFLGWQLNTSPKADPINELGVLPSEAGEGEEQMTDENGNHWPVIPGSVENKTGKLILENDLYLHPMYEYTDCKITFDSDGGLEVPDKWFEKDASLSGYYPVTTKDHMTLDHWVYGENPLPDHQKDEIVDWNTISITRDFDVKAVWKEASWSVNYYDDNDRIIKTYPYQTSIYNGQFDGDEPSKEGFFFLGWTMTKGGEEALDLSRPIAISEETNLYPAFVSSDFQIKLDPNGGKFIKKDGTPSFDVGVINTLKGQTFDTVNDLVTATTEEYVDLVIDEGGTSGRKLIGWVPWQSTDYLSFPFTISKTTTENSLYLMAIYANPDQFLVTFDASPGCFSFYDNYGTEYSTPTLSYVVDKGNYSSTKPCNVGNVYQDALDSKKAIVEGEEKPCVLLNDGYYLNAGSRAGYNFSGWTYSGAAIVTDYPLGSATAFNADWLDKPANNFWTDDWGTIIRYANQGFEKFKEKYEEAYYSESSYYNEEEGYSGTKYGDVFRNRGSFVGLERDFELVDYGKFRTRIIGQSQDVISGETNKKALFTFDFIQCPMTGSIGSNNNYATGYIPKNYAPLLRGAMSSTLRQNLQIVTKAVLNVSSSGVITPATDDEYIFAASAYEVNGGITNPSGTGVQNSSAYDEAQYASTWGDLLFRYDWYAKTYDNVGSLDDRVISDRSSADLTKHYRGKTFNLDGEDKPVSWLLRTPVHTYKPFGGASNTNCSFYVCGDSEDTSSGKPYLGGIYEYYSSDTRGFSPCFCLGVQQQA